MSIGSRIKELRVKRGITQEELAEKIGVTKGAIGNYENGISSPKIELMYKLFDVLDCDANYLHQDDMKTSIYKDAATPEEFEKLVKPYRNLDDYGRESIDIVMRRESGRVMALQVSTEKITQLKKQLSMSSIPSRLLAYYGKNAAAGKSIEFSDVMAGTLEAPLNDINKNADYTIGVSGDSMEPTFYDGDIVYVQKASQIDLGEIGIFQKEGYIYIKEVGENGLISHNSRYKPMEDKAICMGKVLGKVEEPYKIING